MTVVAIIPARMGSNRFPGKPLAPLLGRPMLQWVYEGTARAAAVSQVLIATCDEEIADAARRFGAPVVMTSPDHERASDRVAEAARTCTASTVVMVQGDEPMIRPEMIERAVEPFSDPAVLCTNLSSPIDDADEYRDPNTVKVVSDRHGNAMYFSREPIPALRDVPYEAGASSRQVCVIGFRRAFLDQYSRLPQTRSERYESIDMLRILEHGYPIRVVPIPWITRPVDTPEDLARVEQLMAEERR